MGAFGSGVFGAGIFGAGGGATTPDPAVDPGTGAVVTDGGSTAQPTPIDPRTGARLSPMTLVGVNGDVIPLKLAADDYGALQGAAGFGIPPRVLTMFEGAGDGGIVRYARTGPRDIDIPVGIFGASRGEVLERQRRLASALRPRLGRDPATLRWRLESGEVFQTAVWYAAGADTQDGADGTSVFTRWLLTLRCPDPYWTSVDETPFLIASAAGGAGLLPYLAELRVSGSAQFGQVQINNPGDVPADVRWEITGPGGPFTAQSDTGESFTITDPLAAGETIVVDTRTGSVTDQAGENRYASLGPAPKLFQLPEGLSTVQVALEGATADSTVVGRYRARREVIY